MANLSRVENSHYGKITVGLTHHSPTLRRKRHSFYGYLLLIFLTPGRITKAGSCEEFSSVTEMRGGSWNRKEIRLQRPRLMADVCERVSGSTR